MGWAYRDRAKEGREDVNADFCLSFFVFVFVYQLPWLTGRLPRVLGREGG